MVEDDVSDSDTLVGSEEENLRNGDSDVEIIVSVNSSKYRLLVLNCKEERMH